MALSSAASQAAAGILFIACPRSTRGSRCEERTHLCVFCCCSLFLCLLPITAARRPPRRRRDEQPRERARLRRYTRARARALAGRVLCRRPRRQHGGRRRKSCTRCSPPLMMHDRELLQRVYRAEQAAAARFRPGGAVAGGAGHALAGTPATPGTRGRAERRAERARSVVATSDRSTVISPPSTSRARPSTTTGCGTTRPRRRRAAARARSAELSAGAVARRAAVRRPRSAGHRVALQRRPWRPSTAGGFRSPPAAARRQPQRLSDRPRGPPRSPAVDDATKIAAVELQRHARGLPSAPTRLRGARAGRADGDDARGGRATGADDAD